MARVSPLTAPWKRCKPKCIDAGFLRVARMREKTPVQIKRRNPL